ncbi:hypothetical protein QAD02_010709 [Eretmocerus hayati]|uniref:Uncharacterized protein n=1 Tax=Eretmocerus hayati TaxID=131215 RepID=A0ACC2NVL9_9HYME|nr:hypothetical protein QAD02_010709 [Eretmocerus hayati]
MLVGCSCKHVMEHPGSLCMFLNHGEYSDVVIKVRNEAIAVLKIILCNASEISDGTSKTEMIKGRTNELKLEEYLSFAMKDLIKSCYTGQFSSLGKDNVDDLFILYKR